MIKFVCILFVTIVLYSCNSDEIKVVSKEYLEFKVLGQINNSEIRDYIVSTDSFKFRHKSQHFAWWGGGRTPLRKTLGFDYLVVEVKNQSEFDCHCGIGYNGFLATTPTALYDSLKFSPAPGFNVGLHHGTCGGGVLSEASVLIPPNSSRMFLVQQPPFVDAPNHLFKVGYAHDCRMFNRTNLPIDSINTKYLKTYFVYDYDVNVNIVDKDKIGQMICD